MHVEQGLDVVVHVLKAVQIGARLPIEAVEERGEKRWRVLGQPLLIVSVPKKSSSMPKF